MAGKQDNISQEAMFSSELRGFLFSHRTVKCTKHNWKLNMLTMKYINPPDSFMQDELGKFLYIVEFSLKFRIFFFFKAAIYTRLSLVTWVVN